MLTNATVLITGGTGSFGHTMVRHLMGRGCAEIRVFSRDETKQDAMRNEFSSDLLTFHIGDVRDNDSTTLVVRGVDHVFHAAALKQVPSCEFFPLEAIKTNVLGSSNVIRAAVAAGARSVVCLSTDKAVEPLNAMGMTKGLMEKVAGAESRGLREGDTIVSCVRYGNVLYSRGSVVPLFVGQARAGQPITVTDRRMTRFMMNLDDAVALVEYAFNSAKQGDLFIKKAPGALMTDVAEVTRKLMRSDSEIHTIGIRHGEKLHETLATATELRHSTDCGDYLRIPLDTRDLDYAKYFVKGDAEPETVTAFTSDNADRMSLDEIERLLLTVPEIEGLVDATSERRER